MSPVMLNNNKPKSWSLQQEQVGIQSRPDSDQIRPAPRICCSSSLTIPPPCQTPDGCMYSPRASPPKARRADQGSLQFHIGDVVRVRGSTLVYKVIATTGPNVTILIVNPQPDGQNMAFNSQSLQTLDASFVERVDG